MSFPSTLPVYFLSNPSKTNHCHVTHTCYHSVRSPGGALSREQSRGYYLPGHRKIQGDCDVTPHEWIISWQSEPRWQRYLQAGDGNTEHALKLWGYRPFRVAEIGCFLWGAWGLGVCFRVGLGCYRPFCVVGMAENRWGAWGLGIIFRFITWVL